MILRLREVALELHADESALAERICAELDLPRQDLLGWRVVRQGIDARKKSRIVRIYTVDVDVADATAHRLLQAGNSRLEPVRPTFPPPIIPLTRPHRALVVGMGPAGLFAALHLARSGVRVTLIERGDPVEKRVFAVEAFWRDGRLDPESNVQFGEGGAGTFSDGKLTTRLNHPWTAAILQTLVDCGAPPAILVQARPHVGTDRLRLVLIRLRQKLLALGVEIRYREALIGLCTVDNRVAAAVTNRNEIPCDSLVLAPGHSARDTYAMLVRHDVAMQAKPFAVGVRIEHPVGLINRIQYGVSSHPHLPAADYALTWNDPESGRGVYSFCMCPGGEVIVSSSAPGEVVVNGMSRLKRDSPVSNSALVVAVRPEDFGAGDPLAGVRFQRRWEELAYAAGGGDYRAPAQNLLAFLRIGRGPLPLSIRPGVCEAELDTLLPGFVSSGLRRALPQFDRKMKGFVSGEAALIGIESRTSAPLRIVRGEDGQSLSHPGLYPAGEGAGYAGGIMSAALDGLGVAERILEKQRREV